MSPKDFRKISYPEPKILNSLVNCGQTDRQTDAQTRLDVELTPLPVGQLKKLVWKTVSLYTCGDFVVLKFEQPLYLFMPRAACAGWNRRLTEESAAAKEQS